MSEQTIHRIWISPDGAPGMPEDFVLYGQRWQELNPGWKLHDWTKKELQSLPVFATVEEVVGDLINRSPLGMTETLACQLADVYSYCILLRHGGVYVNCDIDPVRSLSELPVSDEECWACWENPDFLVNAAMGGPAEHPFWYAVCRQLPKRYFSMPGGEMNQATGPHLLTSVYREFRRTHGDIGFVALPRETFNPYMWNDIPANGRLTEEYTLENLSPVTIGVHHWAHRRSMRSNRVEEGSVWSAPS